MDIITPEQITSEFTGLDQAALELLQKPEVLEKLGVFVEKQKAPIIANKTDVLNRYTTLQREVQDLGGIDKFKSLTQQATEITNGTGSPDLSAFKQQAQTEIEKREAIIKDLRQKEISADVSRTLASAIKEADGEPELLESVIRNRIKATQNEAGRTTIVVLNEDGVTPALKSDLTPLGLKDLVNQYKDHPTYKRCFNAVQAGGSGAGSPNGGNGATTVNNPYRNETANFTEQNKLARDNPLLAATLARQAGKESIAISIEAGMKK